MRSVVVFGVLVTVVFAVCVGVSAKEGDEQKWTVKSALKQVDEATKDFRGATAEIEWDELFNDQTVKGAGKLWISLDGRARADVSGNNPRTILAVPPLLYIYKPLEKVTERYYLPANPDLLAQYAMVGFVPAGSAMTKQYEVKLLREDDMDGHKTLLLGLTPKNKEAAASISSFLLWIDETTWLPAQITLRHEGGLQVTLRVLDLQRTENIADDVFGTSWPDGTPVVDVK